MSFFSHVEIQNVTPPTISHVSYHAVTRSPNHQWDLQNCVVLILLETFYNNSWIEKTRVFNAYFRDETLLPVKLSEGALRSMYRQIKDRFDHPIGRWGLFRTFLEDTAASIGVDLELKRQNEVLSNEAASRSGNSNLDMTTKNVLQPPHRSENHGIPTPPRSPMTRQNKTSRIPRLAFRGFNKKNQGINSITNFRAGMFVNYEITRPPHPSSSLYRDEARRHIARVHNGTTPFVSVTHNPIRALHYACKENASSFIGIIDLWKAGRVSNNDDDNNPFVQGVKRLGLNPEDSYQGAGEYLIWGGIDFDAIINVIPLARLIADSPSLPGNHDPFSFQSLCTTFKTGDARREIAKKPLQLDFITGQCVGILIKLFKFPSNLVDYAVFRITKDWRFHKYQTWRKNQDFLNGVNNEVGQGFSRRSEASLSWDATFTGELRQAASESSAQIEYPRQVESFIDELKEAASFDVSSEDDAGESFKMKYELKNPKRLFSIPNSDRNFCSTIGKRLVDYPDSDEEV